MRTWIALGFAVAMAALVGVSCATKDGDGSETHFVCDSDADCAAHGSGTCVDGHCTSSEGTEDSGAGGSSSDGGLSSGGAVEAGNSGGKPQGSGGNFVCMPLQGDPPFGPSNGGYAEFHGCHPTAHGERTSCAPPARTIPDCVPTEAGSPWEHPASDLPCGTCNEGSLCALRVVPVCDCDGRGPLPPFEHGGDGLNDGWYCQCAGGEWSCFLVDQSGSSCFMVCTEPDAGG